MKTLGLHCPVIQFWIIRSSTENFVAVYIEIIDTSLSAVDFFILSHLSMWQGVKIVRGQSNIHVFCYLLLQVTEIVSKIKTKNELDCKARDIVTIEEGDMDYNAALDKFANILSGDPGSNPIQGWLIFLSVLLWYLYKCICANSSAIICFC